MRPPPRSLHFPVEHSRLRPRLRSSQRPLDSRKVLGRGDGEEVRGGRKPVWAVRWPVWRVRLGWMAAGRPAGQRWRLENRRPRVGASAWPVNWATYLHQRHRRVLKPAWGNAPGINPPTPAGLKARLIGPLGIHPRTPCHGGRMNRAVGAPFLYLPVTWADGPGWYKSGLWPLVLHAHTLYVHTRLPPGRHCAFQEQPELKGSGKPRLPRKWWQYALYSILVRDHPNTDFHAKWHPKRDGGFMGSQPSNLRAKIEALWPPKPKELLITAFTGHSRVVLGT